MFNNLKSLCELGAFVRNLTIIHFSCGYAAIGEWGKRECLAGQRSVHNAHSRTKTKGKQPGGDLTR